MLHRLEVAERIRIVERSVLAESFDVIGPLHVMAQAARTVLPPANRLPKRSKSMPQVLPPPSAKSSNCFVRGW